MQSDSIFSNNIPSARKEIESLRSYSAPLEGRRELLRLDFNENTLGPSPAVLEALQNIPAHHISIYPEYEGLREAVVANLRGRGLASSLNPDQIGLFNGVDAAINAIFHAYGDREDLLLTTNPTFGYYMPCAYMQGMEVVAVSYEGFDFKFPIDTIKKILLDRKPKLLILCNPNNPTGTRLDAEIVLEFASLSPETLIVIDELYEAFAGDSVLPIVNFRYTPNLIILRSLAKTAGLAGLRIGFAIGSSDVVNRIHRVTGPYDVNSFAVTAAFAALADQSYTDNYVREILNSRHWLESRLETLPNRYHLEGGNFFLIWPRSNSCDMVKSLKLKGILVRDMSGKKLIDGSIRVSIGTIEQMQKFLDAFSSIEKSSCSI